MIVVDASALIAFFLREEGWTEIAQYMVQTASIDHALKEFYNALWKSIRLKGIISVEDASRIISLLETYCEKNMVLENEGKYLKDAFKISLEHNITVYDALYIAQAAWNGTPLLTLDQMQRQIAIKMGIKVIP